MADALSCMSPGLFAHGDGVVIVFAILGVAALLGGLWGVLCSWLALPLDRLYRWFYQLPECTPGHCYCRRTCIYMFPGRGNEP